MTNPPPSSSRRRVQHGACMLLIAAAALARGAAADAFVEGSASYRERIAVPPGAVFEAVLEDVSLADAPAERLGVAALSPAGNPPFHFRIPYDPARIQPSHRYNVRGRLLLAERLLFTTDQSYPVLTQGQGNRVELLMRKVGAPPKAGAPQPLGALPAGFEGTLPCADCPGLRLRVDLWPDGLFVRRSEYVERGVVPDEIGRWSLSGATLVLAGGAGDRQAFRIGKSGALQALGADGLALPKNLGAVLKRVGLFRPLEPRMKLDGVFTYLADAGLFTECATGRRFPVAQEGDNAALESAYSKARREPGAPVGVRVQGTLAQRPKIDGQGMDMTLVVERFLAVLPDLACGPASPPKQRP